MDCTASMKSGNIRWRTRKLVVTRDGEFLFSVQNGFARPVKRIFNCDKTANTSIGCIVTDKVLNILIYIFIAFIRHRMAGAT